MAVDRLMSGNLEPRGRCLTRLQSSSFLILDYSPHRDLSLGGLKPQFSPRDAHAAQAVMYYPSLFATLLN